MFVSTSSKGSKNSILEKKKKKMKVQQVFLARN